MVGQGSSAVIRSRATAGAEKVVACSPSGVADQPRTTDTCQSKPSRDELTDIPDFLRRTDGPTAVDDPARELISAVPAIEVLPTREAWLERAVDFMRPWFTLEGKPLPSKVRVSIGFAYGSRRLIGQCWPPRAAADGIHQIFVAPICEPIKLLGVLAHELCHAALPPSSGHRKSFQRLAAAIGLAAPWTATAETPGLVARLNELMATKLGACPHATLMADQMKKKQTTRLNKVECHSCGYKARVTWHWLNQSGPPLCPCSLKPMQIAN